VRMQLSGNRLSRVTWTSGQTSSVRVRWFPDVRTVPSNGRADGKADEEANRPTDRKTATEDRPSASTRSGRPILDAISPRMHVHDNLVFE